MSDVQIEVTVLRYKSRFVVNCKVSEGFEEFKKKCKRLCPLPVEDFLVIVGGKVLEKQQKESWEKVVNRKKVFILVKSFIENNEPDEFFSAERMHKIQKLIRSEKTYSVFIHNTVESKSSDMEKALITHLIAGFFGK